MILADTSAWIEYLRGTGSSPHLRVRALLSERDVATTEVVIMELLAGAREAERIRSLLARCELLHVGDLQTWEDAAAIYRACRTAGEAVRGFNDCLIAAVAIREGVAVLAADRDFAVLARHTPLRLDAG